MNKRGKGKVLLMFNEEFTILSVASVMIFLISAGLNIATIYKSTIISSLLFVTVIIVYAVFAVLAIIMVIIIHRSSCAKLNMIDKSPIYIEAYIYRAADLGLINENQIRKVWNKLNPNNRLHRADGSEIS